MRSIVPPAWARRRSRHGDDGSRARAGADQPRRGVRVSEFDVGVRQTHFRRGKKRVVVTVSVPVNANGGFEQAFCFRMLVFELSQPGKIHQVPGEVRVVGAV